MGNRIVTLLVADPHDLHAKLSIVRQPPEQQTVDNRQRNGPRPIDAPLVQPVGQGIGQPVVPGGVEQVLRIVGVGAVDGGDKGLLVTLCYHSPIGGFQLLRVCSDLTDQLQIRHGFRSFALFEDFQSVYPRPDRRSNPQLKNKNNRRSTQVTRLLS